ncbi:MAG: protein kinase [Myxococcales bacterium]|nr:protein kinase [Myxococcales bacterium]
MSTSITGPSTAGGGGDRDLEAGTAVGEYEIQAKLGAGGFGTVYRAAHPVIGKQVAIKVLARKYSADEDMVSRFIAEARAVNQIRHRNIIDIFSFGTLDDGRAYYMMELLEGEPLDQVLDARGRIPLDEAVPILKAIAKALDAAHAKSIAHRDLKPENIFLAQDSEGERYPKLLDFGIAKLMGPENTTKHKTATGAPIGTPYYMSPEQCRGKDVDHRTDIYSLGVVAYRLLTGAYPFDADGYLEIMMKQIGEEPVPPSSIAPELPPSVDAAIARMMRKDPAQRPASCAAGIAALVAGAAITPSIPSTPLPATSRPGGRAISGMAATQLSDAGLAATMVPTTQPPGAPVKRTGLWVALGAIGVGGAAVAAVLAIRGDEPTRPTPAPKPQIAVPPPPIDAAVAPPVIDAASKDVVVTVEGAPEGTEVRIGASPIGVVPAISVPRGGSPVVLSFYADGYLPMSKTVTPDRDQRLEITLKKKKTPAVPVRPAQPDPDDRDAIPDPFGANKR